MSRIYLSAKEKVEDCMSLSISSLKKSGALKYPSSGTISWNCNSLAYEIGLGELTSDCSNYLPPYISLSYSVTSDENYQKDINQKFRLTKTICNFSGCRYWFVCDCGKQVAFLYKPYFADMFACRHCYNLTYESRNLTGSLKGIGRPLNIPELNALRESVKRIFYKGKLTKRFIKYERKLKQFKTYHDTWFSSFNKRFLGTK